MSPTPSVTGSFGNVLAVDLAEAIAATLAAVPDDCRDTAAAYVHERPLAPGTVLLVDRQPEVVHTAIYLGFVDCQAGKNWGHRCRYVRCKVADVPMDGETVSVTEAQFPPTLKDGRIEWAAHFVGRNVPDWALLG